MLSDEIIESLTAFVDGELSPRKREAVLRLVQRSMEARTMLAQLQANARRLQHLPRQTVQPSLAPEVVKLVSARQTTPSARRPAKTRRPWQAVAAAGLAASLLLATMGGLYYRYIERANGPTQDAVAALPAVKPIERALPAVESVPTPHHTAGPLIAQAIEGAYSQFGAPIPPDRAFTITFGELRGEGAASGQLAYELAKDRSLQLDVVVKNNPLALERLRSVLNDHGIKVVLDPDTGDTLKKAPAAEYWVYAENLATDELTAMLKELSKDDNRMKAFARTPYEKLTINAFAVTVKQELSAKLGIAPAKLDPATPATKVAPPARWERQAVVLPLQATPLPPAEVRTYVNQRRPVQPGTLQVLVKIRQEK